jgi:hypothetical protein
MSWADDRKRYKESRAFEAKQERNRGKTAHQLVAECAPLDIDAIYKICVPTKEVKR